jgi:hypothetical protein
MPHTIFSIDGLQHFMFNVHYYAILVIKTRTLNKDEWGHDLYTTLKYYYGMEDLTGVQWSMLNADPFIWHCFKHYLVLCWFIGTMYVTSMCLFYVHNLFSGARIISKIYYTGSFSIPQNHSHFMKINATHERYKYSYTMSEIYTNTILIQFQDVFFFLILKQVWSLWNVSFQIFAAVFFKFT